ncbi:MAG: lysophospholipid acyltransferase family protein [Dissulfurimicrobium sp.]|uniref:lysophospholipid acyltransferase family protein n=1 Tax=Dissulfurimicrobium sp. TaxID=2022436 RepID=UPI0040497D09
MFCKIRAPLFFLVAVLSFGLFGSVAIALSFLPGSRDYAHRIGIIWSRILFWAAGAKLFVTGRENIPSDRPVVFASNHASQFDIPILYLALGVQFRFLVKKELFHIPLLGTAMKRAGYIPIDRSGGRAAILSLKKAAQRIKEGTSIVVFPEGTRSVDGRLQPFKSGGMQLAIHAGCPIVPVAISGSHELLPKGSLSLRPGPIHVAIGRPIDPNGSRDDVTRKTWDAINAMLGDLNRSGPGV